MSKTPVSLVIITLNEEQNIARCIQSVPWADEVLVMDSGSSDRTQEIVKSLGAKVIEQKFLGFREQKQKVTDMARNDWVLSLDADEALSPELSQEILNAIGKGLVSDGYDMPRMSFHFGKWIKHGGWYPDRQLRLFNRKKCKWVGGHVHEKVECENCGHFSCDLKHWVFKDLADQVNANNRYSTLGALDLHDQGKKFCFKKLFFKPISKFVETYILKGGFLDGLAGFVISVGAAYSVFLKFSKLKEIQMHEQRARPMCKSAKERS